MADFNTEQFYNNIADKYNWFFSSREKIMENQADEIKTILEKYNAKTILDCSCGNGLQAISLAKQGYIVDGGDISENMLKKAAEFAKEENININFRQADFRELEKIFFDKYDCVLSWGNAIPHLMTEEDIKKAVSSIYRRLNENGIAIIEMSNFDNILASKNRFIPMRINDIKEGFRYSILYVLDYLPESVLYNIIYLMENLETGEKKMEHESVYYNPIKKTDFLIYLEDAGFNKIYVDENNRVCYIAQK